MIQSRPARNRFVLQTQGPHRKEWSQKAEAKKKGKAARDGAGAELESWQDGEKQEGNVLQNGLSCNSRKHERQRLGADGGHPRTLQQSLQAPEGCTELSVPGCLFWSMFWGCLLLGARLLAEGYKATARQCLCCSVTAAHRHAMTQRLYMALKACAGVKGWDLQVLQLQGPFMAHNSSYSEHVKFSCFLLQRTGAVSPGLFHVLLNSTPALQAPWSWDLNPLCTQ